MKTLAAIRSRSEKKDGQTMVAENGEGRIVVTERQMQFVKKADELEGVIEDKRKELIDLNDTIDKRKEEVMVDIDRMVSEAKAKANAIVSEARQKLSKAETLVQANEQEQKVLKVREQEVNRKAEENTTVSKELDKRGKSIMATESQIAEDKSAIVKARGQSEELVATLAAILLTTIDQVEAISRLSKGAEFDLSDITNTFSVISKTFSDWQLKLQAKDEHLDRREEQINTERRILKSQRTRLRMTMNKLK